jgi:hypothetical protein
MLKQRISLYIVRRMIMNDFLNMNIYGAVRDVKQADKKRMITK